MKYWKLKWRHIASNASVVVDIAAPNVAFTLHFSFEVSICSLLFVCVCVYIVVPSISFHATLEKWLKRRKLHFRPVKWFVALDQNTFRSRCFRQHRFQVVCNLHICLPISFFSNGMLIWFSRLFSASHSLRGGEMTSCLGVRLSVGVFANRRKRETTQQQANQVNKLAVHLSPKQSCHLVLFAASQ